MINWEEAFSGLFSIQGLISLFTLAVLEIVLGIDNIIFISITASKLTVRAQQKRARFIGLLLALLIRCIMLLCISWIANMTTPLFTVFEFGATGRDLILFGGGVFLLVKTTTEIHNRMEGEEESGGPTLKKISINAVVIQIVLIDIVFSFDSILTAVGLSNNIVIMILAVIIAMIMMILFSEKVSDFINEHPTIKMLALAFLIVIGIMLILDACHQHVPKEYIYSAMAFSLFVESLNMRERKKSKNKDYHPD